MHINSLDYVVRIVPRYGYLPLVVAHDRTTGKTHEYYRGEFKATAEEALTNAVETAQSMAEYTPPIAEFFKKQQASA